jgi:hypothetical protein
LNQNKGGFMALQEKAYDVDNRTGSNHEGPYANTPVRRLTATSIIGDSVENAAGEDLGKIDNLMVNLNTGEIEYAVLEFGSFLGRTRAIYLEPRQRLPEGYSRL